MVRIVAVGDLKGRGSFTACALHVAQNLRDSDRREVKASHGLEPLEAVVRSCESGESFMAFADGVPFAVFGCARQADGTGCLWLLATDLFAKNWLAAGKVAFMFVRECLRKYPVLWNDVRSCNDAALRLLARLGARLDAPRRFGVRGKLFQRFYIS